MKAGLLSHRTDPVESVKVCGPLLRALLRDVGSSAVSDVQGSLKLVHPFEMGDIAQGRHTGKPTPGGSADWLAPTTNNKALFAFWVSLLHRVGKKLRAADRQSLVREHHAIRRTTRPGLLQPRLRSGPSDGRLKHKRAKLSSALRTM